MILWNDLVAFNMQPADEKWLPRTTEEACEKCLLQVCKFREISVYSFAIKVTDPNCELGWMCTLRSDEFYQVDLKTEKASSSIICVTNDHSCWAFFD